MTEPRTAPRDHQRLLDELQFLSELARVLASTTELQPILDWLVEKTTRLLAAEEGSIRLQASGEAEARMHTIVKRKSAGEGSGSWPAGVSFSVAGALEEADHLATPDLRGDPRFPGLHAAPGHLRAVLAVPLRVEGRTTGMLAVTESRPGRDWTEGDIQLLRIVASHSAAAIEQARLRAEAVALREIEERNRRIERELARARETQRALVPAAPLDLAGWRVAGRVEPARQVGGDAFDYTAFDEHRLGLAIADVAGKGVPAALLMSNAVASLRALCNGRSAVETAVARLNASIRRAVAPGDYLTLLYAEFDTRDGALRYVNAGHTPGLLRRADGSIEALDRGGLPLGFLDDAGYEAGAVTLAPGDAVLLFSDGVNEARDADGTEYGLPRLRALWSERGGAPAEDALAAILEDVAAFRGAAEPSDDLTVVVLARGGA